MTDQSRFMLVVSPLMENSPAFDRAAALAKASGAALHIVAFDYVHEAARDVARRIAATPEYVRSRHERKKVEMLFAHLKRILKLDRLRLRGLSGATDEFTLAAAVQNLRRLAKFTSQGPPATG